MTIAQAHRQAKETLIAAGETTEEAHATARILLDHLTGRPHAHLVHGERDLSSQQQEAFLHFTQQLAAGYPLPYITGTREFYGLSFLCDCRALIPRPETELLVEQALALLSESGKDGTTLHLADLGTGTGCIAVTLAKHLPQARICATDMSAAALQLARQNAERHGVTPQIDFIPGQAGDWATPLQAYSEFDIVLSNPPYIATEEITRLQIQVKDYEPYTALDGGVDGLDDYRRLAAQCRSLLRPGGWLLCELGAGQWDDVKEIFETENWRVGEAILDLQGITRVLSATRDESLETQCSPLL